MKGLKELIQENKEADEKARRKRQKEYLENLYYETIEDAIKDGVF